MGDFRKHHQAMAFEVLLTMEPPTSSLLPVPGAELKSPINYDSELCCPLRHLTGLLHLLLRAGCSG
ncbi:mCG1036105 [Mus musculus]|nr:mCG1036105 [Mus musculus]